MQNTRYDFHDDVLNRALMTLDTCVQRETHCGPRAPTVHANYLVIM